MKSIILLFTLAFGLPNEQIPSGGTNSANGISYINGSIDYTEGIGAFMDISVTPNSNNLDIGGGQFDTVSDWLKEKYNVTNYVFDPFQRSKEHNAWVLEQGRKGGFDSVSLMSVLNVISSEKVRLSVLKMAHDYVKPDGRVVIKIWKGDGSGIESIGENRYQSNRPSEWYLDQVRKVFDLVYSDPGRDLILAWRD